MGFWDTVALLALVAIMAGLIAFAAAVAFGKVGVGRRRSAAHVRRVPVRLGRMTGPRRLFVCRYCLRPVKTLVLHTEGAPRCERCFTSFSQS